MQTIIGIDFSINSTGICHNENDKLNYISHFKCHQVKGKVKENIKLLETSDNFKISYHDRVLKNPDYSLGEFEKITDASIITNSIIEEIDKIPNISMIGLEGFSYQSIGASFIELVGYQYLLREKILNKNIKLKILSPTQIKQFVGKGNYKKEEMIEFYLNNKMDCAYLDKCEIRKIIINNEKQFRAGKNKWTKPFEDLVDSYWAFKFIQNILQ